MKKINDINWEKSDNDIANEMLGVYMKEVYPVMKEFIDEYGHFLGGWQIHGLDTDWKPFPNFYCELINRFKKNKSDIDLMKTILLCRTKQ